MRLFVGFSLLCEDHVCGFFCADVLRATVTEVEHVDVGE